MAFELQIRQVAGRVWHVPDGRSLWGGYKLRSGYVSDLRTVIEAVANAQTLPFTLHWRIITTDGNPVERWKTKPGRAKKAWRKQ